MATTNGLWWQELRSSKETVCVLLLAHLLQSKSHKAVLSECLVDVAVEIRAGGALLAAPGQGKIPAKLRVGNEVVGVGRQRVTLFGLLGRRIAQEPVTVVHFIGRVARGNVNVVRLELEVLQREAAARKQRENLRKLLRDVRLHGPAEIVALWVHVHPTETLQHAPVDMDLVARALVLLFGFARAFAEAVHEADIERRIVSVAQPSSGGLDIRKGHRKRVRVSTSARIAVARDALRKTRHNAHHGGWVRQKITCIVGFA